MIEVVYQKPVKQACVDPDLFVAADLGVSVLATLTSNKPGFLPRLVNGGPIKNPNQFYNKQRAHHDEAQPPHTALSSQGEPSDD